MKDFLNKYCELLALSFDLAPSSDHLPPPAPSSDLPGVKTSTPSSNQGLVGRWGRPVLRPGRSEDGAQHLHYKHHK